MSIYSRCLISIVATAAACACDFFDNAHDIIRQTYSLNVTITGEGTVLKTPDKTAYLAGSVVSLTAEPGEGWFFGGWGGDAEGVESQISVEMNGSKAIDASFLVNAVPSKPVILYPPHYGFDVGMTFALRWEPSTDADDHPVTYSVLLGTDQNSLPVYAEGIADTDLIIDDLSYKTTYYVAIIASDRVSINESDIHQFITIGPTFRK